GKATLRIHPANGGLTSAYPFHEPSVRFLGKERWLEPELGREDIDLVSLDSLQLLPPIDVLKMDLQGGERDVLIGGRRKLSNAVAVITEVRFHRIYEGEPLWADVDQQLGKQGFVLHKLLFTKSVTLPSRAAKKFGKRRAANQLLDGDAVYIRRLDDPETVTTDQLKHLAICADAIFQSFDLVAHVLDILAARGVVPQAAANDYVDLMPERLLAETENA
ncbi:MAG: FkbM family methyltransferase, partial [Pseudomonadota bacterium]